MTERADTARRDRAAEKSFRISLQDLTVLVSKTRMRYQEEPWISSIASETLSCATEITTCEGNVYFKQMCLCLLLKCGLY
jgi:hypothetical protein